MNGMFLPISGPLGELLDPLAQVHLESLERDAVGPAGKPSVELVLEPDQRLDLAQPTQPRPSELDMILKQ
ncbi:MAG: hypothetical protein AAGA29_10230 [Planctomycetota bacterium]